MSTPSEPVSIEIITNEPDTVEIVQTPPVNFMLSLVGPQGPQGPPGESGESGIPVGGTAEQVLKKASSADFDTEWGDPSGGTLASLTDVNLSPVPTDGQALVYDTASSKWKPGAVSGGSGGSVAVFSGTYLTAPAEATANTTYATSSTTDADVAPSILTQTFTVPPSGIVEVIQDAYADHNSASMGYEWTVREAGTTVSVMSMAFASTVAARRTAVHRITGLTPGVTKTYTWGFRKLGAAPGTHTIYTGGNGGANGNARMSVRDGGTSSSGVVSGGILLLEAGSAIPSTTPPGTVVYQKRTVRSSAILADLPRLYIRLDEPSGDFADSSGNGNIFTAGTGVVRGKASLTRDTGFAVSGNGTNPVATLSSIPAGLSGPSVTVDFVVDVPVGSHRGTFVNIGTSALNGWGIGIGNTSFDNSGRQLILVANAIAWIQAGAFFPVGISRVTIIRTASNEFIPVVDGVVYPTLAFTPNSATGPVNIGGNNANDRGMPTAITIDDVAIFPAALTTTRAIAHHATNTGQALGWWDGSALQGLS